MFDGLSERELLLYFALVWIAAVAVWILLDFLGNNWPKRRFRARGYRVPSSPRRHRQVVRSLRRFRDEEVRETLETSKGRSTLSFSHKRQIRAASRRRPWWSPDDDTDTPTADSDDREAVEGNDRPELDSGSDAPTQAGDESGRSGNTSR
ncbi:MAG: hypothetical protein ACR2QE_08295 [Acidimicrobiales bacterium]